MRIIGLFICFFAVGSLAQASGFMVPEQGTKATGLANAFTAIADDASAVWYNPAGIAFQAGTQVMAGGDLIIAPGTSYTPAGGVKITSSSETFLLPHLYATWNDPNLPFALGVGINSPFGLSTEWPGTTLFAPLTTFSAIEMVNASPVIAYKLSRNMAVAVGINYFFLKEVALNNTLQLLEGDGDGWGANAAFFYTGNHVNVGVTYRSMVKADIDGQAKLVGLPFQSEATTTVVFPDQINIGLALKPTPALTFSFDADWTNWKRFEEIRINYSSAVYAGLVGAPTVRTQSWGASTALRFGIDYQPSANAYRFGYAFDPTPVDDPFFSASIPDSDRHLFSLGYGRDFSGRLTLDLAYMFVLFETTNRAGTAAFDGKYETLTHLITGTLAYHFN